MPKRELLVLHKGMDAPLTRVHFSFGAGFVYPPPTSPRIGREALKVVPLPRLPSTVYLIRGDLGGWGKIRPQSKIHPIDKVNLTK